MNLNLQIKTTAALSARFNNLMQSSDSSSKSEFLKKIIDNYENPPIKLNEAEQQKIKELETEVLQERTMNEDLKKVVEEYETKLEELRSKILSKELPKGAILLNFNAEFRKYFWGVNELCKKMEYSFNYEELIQKVFTVCYQRGELVLSKEDCAYLESLPYDMEEKKDE